MKKGAIARRLAKEMKISPAYAADQIDRVVHDIVKNLRNGERVDVPGFGVFTPGSRPQFKSEKRRAK